MVATIALVIIEMVRLNKLEKKCNDDDGLLDELSKKTNEQQVELEAIKARLEKFNKKRFLYMPTQNPKPEFQVLREVQVKTTKPAEDMVGKIQADMSGKDLNIKADEVIGTGDKMGER